MSITKFQAVWLSTHLIVRARRTFNKGNQQLFYITMIFILISLVFWRSSLYLMGSFSEAQILNTGWRLHT